MDLKQFDNEEFLSLETFRKTGVGVSAPIWFAELDGEFLLWTDVNSGKVKRIRNNPQVMVAPCKRMGGITGQWVAALATIDETTEAVEHVQTLLRRKVGIGFALFRQIDKVRDRRSNGRRICIRVSFPDNSGPVAGT
ncbi:MAG: PPOX class F420-dependent oxidoreductase [Cellulomonas sp.]